MKRHLPPTVLVVALTAGLLGVWPSSCAAANPPLHELSCGATWTFILNGFGVPAPTPSDFPGPSTLTNCTQPVESGGGGTLSNLLIPPAYGSPVSGTASVAWANGGTSTFEFTETTVHPTVFGGPTQIPKSYRPCEMGYPYITVVEVTGKVTSNTTAGAVDPGVGGRVKALICEVRGIGTEAGLGFVLAKHHAFHF